MAPPTLIAPYCLMTMTMPVLHNEIEEGDESEARNLAHLTANSCEIGPSHLHHLLS
jgi:hypothetical protein